MCRSARIVGIFIVVMLASIPPVSAGIPEPGKIVYGQVTDVNGLLVISGKLTWTYTPTSGGKAVTVSTDLGKFDGPEGPYSFLILIPFEAEVTGYPAADNTIPLSDQPVTYNRTVQIDGTTLAWTDSVNISSADRGRVENVSITGVP